MAGKPPGIGAPPQATGLCVEFAEGSRPMKSRALFAAAVLCLCASGASANVFDVQIIDTVEGTVYVDTYDNGRLRQSAPQSAETVLGSYILWDNGILNSSFNVSFNIYDQDGITLSDTLNLSGTTQQSFFDVSFISDAEIGS
jgi:hypothetical protein